MPHPAPAPLPYVRQPGLLPHPTTKPVNIIPVYFESKQLETSEAADGTVAAVLTGDVMLVQRRPNGDTIELRSNRAVLFTPLKSLKELQQSDRVRQLQDAVTAAYLEGDVRITFTPVNPKAGEQRLAAERVYYEFATDRAVLTDAVIHTLDPVKNIPMIVRARTVRNSRWGSIPPTKRSLRPVISPSPPMRLTPIESTFAPTKCPDLPAGSGSISVRPMRRSKASGYRPSGYRSCPGP